MRRKTSETFSPPLPSADTAAAAPSDHDTYDAKDKIQNPSSSGIHTNAGNSNGLLEEKKSDTPPSRPAKEAHVSFYDRQHIQKIEYSQARPQKNHVNNNRKPSRRKRPWLLDAVCVGCVVAVGVGLTGVFDNSWTTFLAKRKPKTIQLPPSYKIPAYLMEERTVRMVNDDDASTMPLLLLGIQRQHTLLQHRLLQQQQQQASLIDDNNNTVATDQEESTEEAKRKQSPKGFYYPRKMGKKELRKRLEADYGELEDLKFLTTTHEGGARRIYRTQWERAGRARMLDQPRDDDVEQYWAHDDDWLRNPYVTYDDDNIHEIHQCRRNSWTRNHYPNGLILHELDFVDNVPKLVGEGAYREVFLFDLEVLGKTEKFVLKQIRFELDFEYDMFEYVRVDSIVTERLSSNNLIVDIFGYAGVALIAEAFSNGDIEDDVVGQHDRSADFNPLEEPVVLPKNNFTGSEKLKLALDMVKPVAALHNFKDGVIVHDDIQLSQFLWTDETKTAVKLNDFNRAEVMFWDEEHWEYCKYRNGRGHGDWRSPEEYRNDPINEKIDVWSLGNNFYSLLTGYYPFPDEEDHSRIKRLIARGEVTELDPRYHDRSFSESKLADIIFLCYTFEADERPSITEIQHLLEDAIAEDNRRKESGEPWVYLPPVEEANEHDDEYDGEEDEEEEHHGSESESGVADFEGSDSNSDLSGDEKESPVVDSPLEEADADLEKAEEHFDEAGNDSGQPDSDSSRPHGAGAKKKKALFQKILTRKMMRR